MKSKSDENKELQLIGAWIDYESALHITIQCLIHGLQPEDLIVEAVFDEDY